MKNMKNRKMVTMSLLTALLVCGLALAGCKNDANPFLGAWTRTEIIDEVSTVQTLNFAESTWSISVLGITFASGSYTWSGAVATLSMASGGTAPATITGSTLTLGSGADAQTFKR
jgi:outer membrane murein-binding lipoprotein Lpp